MCRILFLLLVISTNAIGQTASDEYNNAVKAYENSSYSSALTYLQSAATKLKIPSPKIESMRALCYYALDDLLNARIALDKYFHLVTSSHTNSEDHASYLLISADVNRRLREKEDLFQKELAKKRMDEAITEEQKINNELSSQFFQKSKQASGRMFQIYNATTDKEEYNRVMNDALGKKEMEQFQSGIKKDAEKKSASTTVTINEAFGTIANKELKNHVFPDGPTKDESPFKIESINFNNKIIDYVIICGYGTNSPIREKGSIQGFDLTKLSKYEVSAGSDGETYHTFTFNSPLIWKSGNAKYSNGSSYGKSITSNNASQKLVIVVPNEVSAQIKASFESLISYVKDAKSIRY